MTVRNLDALLQPDHVLVLGRPLDEASRQLFHNIAQSVPPERRTHAGAQAEPGWVNLPPGEPWPRASLAVILEPALLDAATVSALAEQGCRALLWPGAEPVPAALLEAMRPTTMRLLGSRAGGICSAAQGYNLSSLPLTPPPGSIALIAQSQSVAAAAVDWAVGRNVGLSWLAVTGIEADVDVADLLDRAALDPRTRAVALQLSRIRASRKFMSAARAAARIKPVVVLQTQPLFGNRGDPQLRSAAFQRAGLVECTTLGGLFDALAALERIPVPEDGRFVVAGNGAGACALGIDALRRQGLTVVPPPADSLEKLPELAPQARLGLAVDLGRSPPQVTVNALRLLLAQKGVDAVIYVHSPEERGSHQTMAQALIASGLRERLLTVWLGLETALPARGLAALSGIATFPSADEAARALRYRRQHRLTRELLMQTPPPVREASAQGQQAESLLARQPEGQPLASSVIEELFAAYELPVVPPASGLCLRLRADLDPELGMHLRLAAQAGGLQEREVYGFAPLDALLARRMLTDAGLLPDSPAVRGAALPEALVRLGQMLVDLAQLTRLELLLAVAPDGSAGMVAGSGTGLLQPPPPERQRLSLAPYPAALRHPLALRDGRSLKVRPVRAADEPALIELLQRLDPEEVRLRFFLHIRNFSHDMAARMTQVDYDRELSLVVVPPEGGERIVAMATLVMDPDNAEAEYAILVHHDWAGQGIGKHLMRCLLDVARARGVGTVYGDVLAENGPMLAVVRSLGFTIRRDPEDPQCMRVSLRTALGRSLAQESALS